jgi:glycosyltransferase involved in cell wall biosynthesis
MKVDIIIPCYNEDKNIKKLVASWKEVINDNSNFYVYFVENGSSDNTKKNLVYEIEKLNNDQLQVLFLEKNKGYGNGIKFGIKNSHNGIVCWTHADLQIPSEDVEKIIIDFINASDETLIYKGKRGKRKILDQFFTIMMSFIGFLFTGLYINDINAQPKIASRYLLSNLEKYPDDFLFDAHFLYKSKYKNLDIVVKKSRFLKRTGNEAKGGGSLLGKFKLSLKTIRYFILFKKLTKTF